MLLGLPPGPVDTSWKHTTHSILTNILDLYRNIEDGNHSCVSHAPCLRLILSIQVIDYYRKKGSLVDINAERNAKMVTRDIRAVLN